MMTTSGTRRAEEAGAVFVKVALLDGNAMLYAPAPQTVYDESRPAERLFAPASPQPSLCNAMKRSIS